MKLEAVSIKRTPKLTEKWVQDAIATDPGILGLGDLVVRDRERAQPNAGRLDLLLQDPETLKRFEVEIQLGATDESQARRHRGGSRGARRSRRDGPAQGHLEPDRWR